MMARKIELFDPRDEEATSALNVRVSSLMGGKTAASDHYTQVIMKITIIPPVRDKSINHLRRLEIVESVCLLEGHRFLVWLQAHITKFDSFCLHWTGPKMQDESF